MAKINFKEFTLPKGISGRETETGDVRESFANAIYNNIPGIAAKVLAEKIYTHDGTAVYNDKEAEIMRLAASNFCTPRFIDALEKVLTEEMADEPEDTEGAKMA